MSALLKLTQIDKSFADVQVLKNVSLSLAPGEIVSLLGPSGCGKSTLLRIAAGLDKTFQGTLELNPLLQFGRGSGIGVVFQEPRLMPWLSVAQNVGFADGWKADERWVQQLIRDVGLGGRGEALPKQLSGGMAQRAAIARGLVARPQILLLDEPLGALDSLTRTYLQEELLRIWRQEAITTVMVTHDVEEAVYLADRIVILDPRPGRIRTIVDVRLPRPRQRGSAAFAALKEQVMGELRH